MTDYEYMLGTGLGRVDDAREPRANLEKVAAPDIEAMIEAAKKKVDTTPTPAQKESGNYRKGRLRWKGLPLVIETPKGAVRSGKGKDGKAWSVTLKDNYGYVGGTTSDADGDPVDVFLCEDHPDSEVIFVVNQKKQDGSFDEGKAVLGCISEEQAVRCYMRNYSAGWTGFGSVVPLTLPQFKRWLSHGNTSRPIRDSDVSVKTGAARPTEDTGVPSLGADEGAVPQREEQAVQVLRGQGYYGLSKMAGQLQDVLPGHGGASTGHSAGSPGQQQGVHAGQLSVDVAQGSGEKQAERTGVHVQRPNTLATTLGGSSRHTVTGAPGQTDTIRLERRTGVHDTDQRPEENVTNDLVPRPIADSSSLGQGDRHIAGDNRQQVEPRLDAGRSNSAKTADLKTGFETYEPHLFLVKRAGDDASPFTVAVDLDGTLAEKEEPFNPKTIGKPRKRAVKWVRLFHAAGARIIIFTVRGDTKLVGDWCDEHDVPYDHVNENPDQPKDSSGKVIADVYWDDRAYNADDPDEHGPEILRRVMGEDAAAGGPTVEIRHTTIIIAGPDLLSSMEDTDERAGDGDAQVAA